MTQGDEHSHKTLDLNDLPSGYTGVQNPKAVTAHFSSKQLLPFGFVRQHRMDFRLLREPMPLIL